MLSVFIIDFGKVLAVDYSVGHKVKLLVGVKQPAALSFIRQSSAPMLPQIFGAPFGGAAAIAALVCNHTVGTGNKTVIVGRQWANKGVAIIKCVNRPIFLLNMGVKLHQAFAAVKCVVINFV